MKNKVIVLVVVLAVAAGAALLYGNSKKRQVPLPQGEQKQQEEQVGQEEIQPLKVEKTEVPLNQAPVGFPADIPIEAGAKFLQNYNAMAENGLFQATRVFETAKTLDANFKLYGDYIANNGWTLLTSLNQETLKVLSAKKGEGNLQITINENSLTKIRTVDISYSEKR